MKKRLGGVFVAILVITLPVAVLGKVNVVVSIAPQKSFVEKIAGKLADVTVMVPPGASPATYEPKPSQMRKISGAQLYFAIGVPFEKSWLPRFVSQNRQMQIVDITRGAKKIPMVSHHHHGEGHEDEHRHEPAESLDPHLWLSPRSVSVLAQNIASAFEKIDPKNASIYRKNLEKFEKEIEALDKRLRDILRPCMGSAMMVYHPSWGYFARDYGLVQIPIEIEGKEPKPKKLLELIGKAKEYRVRALFVQPQFSKRAAKALAESIGAEIVVADPLAPDWAKNLIEVAKRICKAAR